MAGQRQPRGAESQSPGAQAPHKGGLRLGQQQCESPSTVLQALGAGLCSPSTVCSLLTPLPEKAAGHPHVCHTHPAEINFDEWLDVHGFGLEMKTQRVTGGFCSTLVSVTLLTGKW